MSPGHNVAIESPDNYVFARDAFVRNSLLTTNGTAVVTNKSLVKGNGIYAPWTTTSNLYVGTGEGFFLAHCLANVPSRFESILNPLFSVLEIFLPRIHDLDDHSDSSYMHPVASFFWSITGMLRYNSSDVLALDGSFEPAHNSEKDRAHPIGSLVALLASTIEGDRV
eukprot:gnl/TRDRNA2_/TRDRNA2_186634_c0_seq1.p1 gnl/TRDRNA2_/TRDRNA2_186634_c0~~gnl/TRDRNA2_/TRDRNA2_186634_c0_seq1.p1  ORF type:complete len:191 (-),score=26.48 gnl/TRDRNA2_/TRDRNA2_186634_c0_seq1:62-562(-)